MKPLSLQDISEYWLAAERPEAAALSYKPAVLIECTLNYRSLRAGLNHSEERNYTAWLPESDLAIDWDNFATPIDTELKLQLQEDPDIAYLQGNYTTAASDFEQYRAQLLNNLIRKERLRIYFNPVFGLFSAPEDDLQDFLPLVAEAALGRVEPELRHLRGKFQLHLEQIREAHSDREMDSDELSEALFTRNLRFSESEHRLAEMFSTLAGSVFGAAKPRRQSDSISWLDSELREDLGRIEQEASNALRRLYDEYLTLANEYDIYEIGLQPDNIQVMRHALLWVPIAL
ncbi:MAG: hypothetical protein HY231_05915 [Acidobacteria bacterium]|nr:hypothetical protein [Acidobacteriota bacterium]